MRQRQPLLFPIACILLQIFFFFTCFDFAFTSYATSSYMRDGKAYGVVKGSFRNRWWNYYERGISFADGKFFSEAVADLENARKQRSDDQRMARTYGMHFVDYFPNRELGIVHYQMGDFEEARKYLELSISQFPSAKARFYLDQTRKKLISGSGSNVPGPVILLDLEKNEFRTSADPVSISGSVEDQNFVSVVSVDGIPVFLEGAQKTFPFKRNLSLDQGRHEIDVTARNLLEKSSSRKIVIHVDRSGPSICLNKPEPSDGSSSKPIRISGSVTDDSGIRALTVSGVNIPAQDKKDIVFNQELTATDGAFEIKAVDSLGNTTIAEVRPPHGWSIEEKRNLVATLESDSETRLLAALLGKKDENPPAIQLKDWTDQQTVFLEKIYLEGEIVDDTEVTSASVNQVPVLRRKGSMIFFNQLVNLKEGRNEIIIQAADESGNTATRKITVIRQTPKALTLSERLSVAVLPFEAQGEVSEAFRSFQEKLIASLLDRHRFNLIERDHLEAILNEQKLSQSDLVDKNTAVEIGKLVAAQSIITGSIIETSTGVEVVARMFDTETSEILASEDVYGEGKDLPGSRMLSEGMAVKFNLEFPLVYGEVIQQKGEEVFTSLGSGMVKVPRGLIVYREAPIKHPVTGEVLGSDNEIIGRLRIIEVMQDLSKAKMTHGNASRLIPMDKVVTE